MLERLIGMGAEESAVLEAVERFALEVLRPVGRELDALGDPAQVVEPGSMLWGVFDHYRDFGVDAADLADGGLAPEREALLRAVVNELLGWGDAGLAISLEVSMFPRFLARLSENAALIERFDRPDVVGCWAITEPDHGSDVLLYGSHLQDMPGRPNCVARRDGDQWVIRGQKAAWVSNGTIATAAALFCQVDLGAGSAGMGGFLVPLDDPAVIRGKPLDKLGQRALNQGELFFDDVRVPFEYLIAPPEASTVSADLVLAAANASMGSTFTGVARAAYELAFDYAHERIQGGAPIIRHQNVQATLFSMFRRVQAAQALSRHVMVRNATVGPSVELAIASKVTATQTAFDVASDALGIFGGNGLSREYPIEKVLRDARASMIEDGSNDVLGLLAMQRIVTKGDPHG